MLSGVLMIATIVAAGIATANRSVIRRMGWLSLCLIFGAWATLFGSVLISGPLEWIVQLTPIVSFGVSLSVLTSLMATMIMGLGVVVMRYSYTYLTGESNRRLFVLQIALAVVSAQFMSISATLPGIWVGWIVTSFVLHQLLVFGDPSPALRSATRAKWVIARTGDLVLAVAFSGMMAHAGTAHVNGILVTHYPLWLVLLLAIGLVVRSAVFPLWTWLFYSVEAPTPVSALLHAGILNAGPFLLMRLFPVIASHSAVLGLCIGIGAITAIGGALVSMTQPSVKGMLAYSSAAHMGFMIFMIGIGGVGPAFIHLIGHSVYKAQAFLGSGNSINRWRRLPSQGVQTGSRAIRVTLIALFIGIAIGWLGWISDPKWAVADWGLISVLGMGLVTFLAIGIDRTASRRLLGFLGLGLMTIIIMFGMIETVGSRLVWIQFGQVATATPPLGVVGVALGTMSLITLAILYGWRPNTKTWIWLKNGMGINPVVDRLTARYQKQEGNT